MRRLATLSFVGLAAIGVAACAGDPDTGDFKSEAEKFIESDEFAGEPNVGLEFSDVECEEPAATAVGTGYTCTGTGADGQTYTFGASITGENELQVISIDPLPPGQAATTETTVSG